VTIWEDPEILCTNFVCFCDVNAVLRIGTNAMAWPVPCQWCIGGLQGGEESWNCKLVLVRIVNGTLRTVGLALPCWVKAETLAYLCTPLWPTGSRRPPLSANHAVGNAWLRPSMLEDAKVFARFTYRRTVPLKLVIYMFLFSFPSHSWSWK
jgi:hypothetical protein